MTQQIFTERLDAQIAVPFGRRTARMEHIIHHLGLALGGRPGHCLAERLSLPDLALGAVGIDDFAWCRGCRYGTVICDLERRRIVALFADRQSDEAVEG